MAEIPEYMVWIVVGAIVVEGIALVILTYLIWKSSERMKAESLDEPEEPPKELEMESRDEQEP